MRKILILFLSLQFIGIKAFADNLIQDNFVEKTLANKQKVIHVNNYVSIEDSYVDSTLKNVSIQEKPNVVAISDSYVDDKLSNFKTLVNNQSKSQELIIQDELANKIVSKSVAKSPSQTLSYDFESVNQIPVKLSIINAISSKSPLVEGQKLEFKVLNDVKINDRQILKKDTVVNATLETVSQRQAFGVPANLVIDNFVIQDPAFKDVKLEGMINKIGANRSLWVYPLGYTFTPFFGAGLVVFTVRGGQAIIKNTDEYTVNYYPDTNN